MPGLRACAKVTVIFLLLGIWASSGAGQQPDGTSFSARATRADTSPPLREMAQRAASLTLQSQSLEETEVSEKQETEPLLPSTAGAPTGPDPALQHGMNGPPAPAPLLSFEGVPNLQHVIPPDTNGEVGPNHYVQWVNVSLQIFDKTGRTLIGPVPGNVVWEGFGGYCETSNHGDPVVVYDQFADRWVLTQIFFSGWGGQCVAVSQTPDPTGPYFRYEFPTPGLDPAATKLALWPDAYSFTTTVNYSADSVVGALERAKMLVGDREARIVAVEMGQDGAYRPLPVDVDGPVAPPIGSPLLFVWIADGAWEMTPADNHDSLILEELAIDWSSDEAPTLVETARIDLEQAGLAFDANLCGYASPCVPQRGTSAKLPALSAGLGWRPKLYIRDGVSTIVLSHTVDVDDSDHAGVRWYELRNEGDGWGVSQAGTYAPDADHRWTADLAMDRDGNLLVGYNVSGPDTYPGIRVAGRLATDPPGMLSQTEREIVAGQGFQEAYRNRWGDYSSMTVDPVDGCTFWYTQEYLVGRGGGPWRTHIATFRFPTCGIGRRGTVSGRVTSASNGRPITGALIDVGGGVGTVTDEKGAFEIVAPEGSYEIVAQARGYRSGSRSNVPVNNGGRTTADIELQPAEPARLSGRLIDARHGWGLYGKITVAEHPGGGEAATTVFTDPLDGTFEIDRPPGVRYDLKALASVPGYDEGHVIVDLAPAGSAAVIPLQADQTCTAAGFAPGNPLIYEQFETSVPPPHWSVTDLLGDGAVWTAGYWNKTLEIGGSGNAAAIELLSSRRVWDTTLETPDVELPGTAMRSLTFLSNLRSVPYDGIGSLELSTDGGSSWQPWWSGHSDISSYGTWFRLDLAGLEEETVRFRWHFSSSETDYSSWWYIDNVLLPGECSRLTGAVVAGLVVNARCHEGVAGATVRTRSGVSTQSVATPEDVRLPAGFWWMFVELSGGAPHTETLDITAPGFAAAIASVDLVPGSVRWVEVELHGDVPCTSPRQPASRLHSELGGPPR